LRNKNETDFEYLVRLKLKMRSFFEKEEQLRNELYVTFEEKDKKVLEDKLDEHFSVLPILEKELVAVEKKMFDVSRGLYKGVAIDVQDKLYTKIPLYLKFPNLNNHVGYTGTTRVGKTKNMISDAQQLIEAGWDVIIVDPKGGEGQEILTEVIQACLISKRPEDFRYISPAFAKESELVNLLYGMADDEAASMITTFAESVSDDAFFTGVVNQNTLAVLKALTYIESATDPDGEYTRQLERLELEKYIKLKTLKDVKKKASVSKWNRTSNPNELLITTQEEISDSDSASKKLLSNSVYQNRSMVTFKTLNNYVTFQSIEALQTLVSSVITIPPVDKIGEERYLEISLLKSEALTALDAALSAGEANFAKIAKTHSVLLSQLAYGDIGKVFSGVGINPIANRLLSEDNGLVCVMQPYPMKYRTVASISVMAMLKSIESMMGLVGTSGRANKRRLAIMIDEAGSAVYKGIEDLFNKAGGLGVSLFVYTQSYEDYSLKLGPTNANVIMDNVNTPITMRMNHPESCKRAAESLGFIRKHEGMFMSTEGGAGRFSSGNVDEEIAIAEDISNIPIGMGYIRHNTKTYMVDFPYVPGLKNYPISMPVLDGESKRRELAMYEATILNQLQEA